MDPRLRQAAPREYQDFFPETRVESDDRAETLFVKLPEFKKEQLRVQVTPSRVLRISGERPLGGNKWLRFKTEDRVPTYCDAKEISAKFDAGELSVKQPKLITPAEPQKPPPTQTQPMPEPEPQPAPAPAPAPGPAHGPVAAPTPSYPAQIMQEKRQQKEEDEEGAQKTWKEAKESFDEQAKRGRVEEETAAKNKYEEESRGKGEIKGKLEVAAERQLRGGIFKPKNLKMLAVIVVVAIALVLHVTYMSKVCRMYISQEEL